MCLGFPRRRWGLKETTPPARHPLFCPFLETMVRRNCNSGSDSMVEQIGEYLYRTK